MSRVVSGPQCPAHPAAAARSVPSLRLLLDSQLAGRFWGTRPRREGTRRFKFWPASESSGGGKTQIERPALPLPFLLVFFFSFVLLAFQFECYFQRE